MNRTIKDATVKRYHYDSRDQLRQHLDDYVSAYNFGRLSGVIGKRMKRHGRAESIVADKFRSYGAAMHGPNVSGRETEGR